MKKIYIFATLLIILSSKNFVYPQELNTILMNSTYQIIGYDSNSGNTIFGTGFIIGKSNPSDSSISQFVLVTAKHIFEDITENTAYLKLRSKIDDKFETFLFTISIRDFSGHPFWTSHDDSTIDIAAMPLLLPENFVSYFKQYFINSNWFANDSLLQAWDIHPGDELNFIGFPEHITANDFGFPILRSGIIASYPLYPYNKVKEIYLDGNVFSGNSGSPVYYSKYGRLIGEGSYPWIFQSIIGMMTKRIGAKTKKYINGQEIQDATYLNLGSFIPAQYIRETVEKVPVLIIYDTQKKIKLCFFALFNLETSQATQTMRNTI